MHSLPLLLGYILTALLFLSKGAMAQQGQTLHIVQGKKVTLRADATNALSYIWFKDNEPLNGLHDQRIVIVDPGVYTVIALGDGCNSDMSDPVKIILDSSAEEIVVDLEIRNLPEKKTAWKDEAFNYQLMILNNGASSATDLKVTFDMPTSLEYIEPTGNYVGMVDHQAGSSQLTWSIPTLNAKESLSLWVLVKGVAEGEMITMAKVYARELNVNVSNSKSESKVDIVFFQIPNVFTPNGDGKNETFEIKGLDMFEKRKLRVFNRLGYEVYHSEYYTNTWSGHGLTSGTYFYILELETEGQQSKIIKGYVTVLH